MKQIRQEHLKDVLDVLEEVFRELHVDFYIIGAIARDYWYRRGNKRMRQTLDVDFAVLVSGKDIYHAVRERLQAHQFAVIRRNDFGMVSANGIHIDLLPFGEIDFDASNLWTEGFMEVYQAGTVMAEMETGHVFKAATLPGIVLLKLIAYDDRPEMRQKDARDVAGIIQHFFDLQQDLIYAHHVDLYADGQPDREPQEIAAIAIGREMKKMCGNNEALKNRLLTILIKHIEKKQSSTFVRLMVGETSRPVDEMVTWLSSLLIGLKQS